MEFIEMKKCFEIWVFKLKKHLEPQCFTDNDGVENRYLLCLKKREKDRDIYCSDPVKRNCVWEAWEKFVNREGITTEGPYGFLQRQKSHE